MNDMVEKLNMAEIKMSCFKQHLVDNANQLISTIDGDSRGTGVLHFGVYLPN